jgi:hypothetical protein
MKAKNWIYIVLILVIGGALYYFIQKNKVKTMDDKMVSFAVLDVNQIQRIVITETSKLKADLVRQDNGKWKVNDLYNCRPENIRVILDGISKVRIKSTVPKAAIDNVLKNIATNGIKVEIYDAKNDLLKSYFMGNETPDNSANYILMVDPDNDKPYAEPMIVEIPGFNGYLRPRYFGDQNMWRDIRVFETELKELNQIEVKWQAYPDSSFVISHLGNNQFTLKKLNGESIQNFDTNALKRYLIYYKQAAILNYLKDAPNPYPKLDSIGKTAPFLTIAIIKNGKKSNFEFFRKPIDKERIEGVDPTKVYDLENDLVRFNEPKEFAVAQITNLGKWYQTWKYFVPSQTVKK